jgi:hypothetical protein
MLKRLTKCQHGEHASPITATHALLESRVELATRQHLALLLLHAMLRCYSLQAATL